MGSDIWGRIRRTNEGARAQYLATEEARRGVMLTLVSDVSQAYFELLGLRLQLEIAKESTQSYTATLKLLHDGSGRPGNALQTSRAATDLANAAGSIPELERQIALKENQISVLMGKNPGTIEQSRGSLGRSFRPRSLQACPRFAGAPAGCALSRANGAVCQRPDRCSTVRVLSIDWPHHILRQIEHAARRIFLSARRMPGASARMPQAPSSTAAVLRLRNGKRSLPGNKPRPNTCRRRWSAFRDVSDALISREKFDAIRAEQARAVQANEEAVRLYACVYVEGLSATTKFSRLKQRLYPAQLALAQTEINRRLVVVQLYKALGGGWNLTDAQWMAANPSRVRRVLPQSRNRRVAIVLADFSVFPPQDLPRN